jgi:uncharacterized protein (TIGR03435 family)
MMTCRQSSPFVPDFTFPKRPILSAALLSLALIGAALGQSPRPTFEVATIKLNTSGDARRQMIRPLPGGGISVENAPVRLLILNAYGVKSFQILGGRSWINSDRWDIEAKPERSATSAQTVLMLQTLLEDRFKLSFHHETKELPVYSLTAAKSGLKLEPPKEGNCRTFDPTAPPPPPGSALPPCGRLMITMSSTTEMRGAKVPMAELVRILSNMLDRSVIDKTGFTGTFDVHFEFNREAVPGLPGSGAASVPSDPGFPAPDPDAASIFTVLQEKLGLKLESTKGPVEVMVIDRLEKPTAN